MGSIGDLKIKLSTDTRELLAGLRKSENALKRSARQLSAIGSDFTTKFTLPFAAAGIAGGKFAVDLETAFSKVENLVGISGDQLEGFKNSVKALSAPTAKFQGELADGLFVITSAGLRGAAALDVLESSAKASNIGLGQTAEIARATTAVMQAYAASGITAAQSTDTLTAIIRTGNLEAESLAPVLGKVVGLAAQMGVSFQEVGANIATFTRLGVSAESAVTSLSGLLAGIIKPTKESAAALESVGMSTDGLRASIKNKGLQKTLAELMTAFEGNDEALARVIPSVEALRAVLGTAGVQGEAYAEVLREIESATGIVDEGFENVQKTSAFKFKQALVGLQNASIELGAALLPLVIKIVDGFNSVIGVISNLNPTVKSLGISFAFLLAAVGPITSGIAGVMNSMAMLRKIGTLLITSNIKVANSFVAMDRATKATTIGLVIVAVTLAVVAFDKWNRSLSKNSELQEINNSINKEAQSSIVAEKTKVGLLVAAIKDENTSKENRLAAVKQLQAISPEYFGNLDTEKNLTEDVTKAGDAYIESLLKQAKIKARIAKIEELEIQKIEALNKLQDKSLGSQAQRTIFGDARYFAGVAKEIQSIDNQIKSLSEEAAKVQFAGTATDMSLPTADALGPVAPAAGTEKAISAFTALTNKQNELTESIRNAITLGKDYSSTLLSLNKVTEEVTRVTEELDAALHPEKAEQAHIHEAIVNTNKLTIATQGAVTAHSSLKTAIEALAVSYTPVISQIQQLTTAQQMAKQTATSFSEGLTDLVNNGLASLAGGIGTAIGELATGAASVADIGKRALIGFADFLISVGKLAIQTGIAVLGIKLALESLHWAVAIAAGVALVALGTAVKSKLSKSSKGGGVPALAEGGIASGPTLALVGEYSGARSNPEVIAPLNKLQAMIGGMGNQIHLDGMFRISGSDLVLALDRAQTQERRIKGR